jgi:hypothetical protein
VGADHRNDRRPGGRPLGDCRVAARRDAARYGATIDRSPEDGAARTRAQIDDAIAERYAQDVSARRETVDGVPTVAVTVHASVPPLGLWGPGVDLSVTGHGVQETAP